MNQQQIMQILKDTAYVRLGGREDELRCARYLQAQCQAMGLQTHLEPFPVRLFTMHEARLFADGKEIPCKGYFNAADADLEAEFLYLPQYTPFSLSQCKGKIVLIDGGLGYWVYQDLLEHGAAGFITYDGNVNYPNSDIDQKELRFELTDETRLPGVNINAKDALALVRSGVRTVRIVLKQDIYQGDSHNVVLDLPGETDEWILLCAHYDSTSLSTGAYDNMSSCIALLAIAEHFAHRPRRRGLRFVWCGSEERGLLGAKAYCDQHSSELHKIAMNINLDMLGSIMGKFVAYSTAEDKMANYLQYLGDELGVVVSAVYGIRSSDSSAFADAGVPATSFLRAAPETIAPIHNRYDTLDVLSPAQLLQDVAFIIAFTERMVDAVRCPMPREIPQKIKDDLDVYMSRKRKA